MPEQPTTTAACRWRGLGTYARWASLALYAVTLWPWRRCSVCGRLVFLPTWRSHVLDDIARQSRAIQETYRRFS
jgi:hypothetical protein